MVAKFAADDVIDTGGAPSLANISANFRKKLKRSSWDTLGLGGKLIHEKKPEANNLVTLSLSEQVATVYFTSLPVKWAEGET